ncbi:hypothetical protein VM98_11625 [Streptomyces rubellomurinus subsp. indigoferus]|nr:hypothetical protein VM98_11625 [Streptomyces rubellomurinus subsp. indigoferus]
MLSERSRSVLGASSKRSRSDRDAFSDPCGQLAVEAGADEAVEDEVEDDEEEEDADDDEEEVVDDVEDEEPAPTELLEDERLSVR